MNKMEYNLNGDIITDKIKIYNCDCMDLLKQTPDKYYDLAIVDPPYGIGESKKDFISRAKSSKKWKRAKAKIYVSKNWDNESPNTEYFDELFRVSKNQIIWGANHFISKMPYDCSGWIFWDKKNGDTDFSDGELAFTSFKKGLRKFEWLWNGFQKKQPENRFHPTQKPVALYKWLLQNYAKQSDKILDTHLGSMSIAIACHDYDFDLTGCELDTEYYQQGKKRIQNHVMQLKMF